MANTPFSIPKHLQGAPLSHYDKEAEIGTGSFGRVCSFRLRRSSPWLTLGRGATPRPERMAVKSILLSESRKQVLRRELGIALRLNHENVTRIVGAEAGNDLLHIKMELANADLSALKRYLGVERFGADNVRYLAHQILNGLCHLHSESIVHRDLKPQNILAFWSEQDGQSPPDLHSVTLKLADFGLSRFIPDNPTTTFTVVGTRQYMAPEVAQALHRGDFFRGDYKKADVFSAGVVAYEVISDRRPFTEIDLIREEELIAPMVDIAEEGQELIKCLNEMLRWRSADRCGAEYARRIFRPKASSAYMESTEGWYGIKPFHRAARNGDLETAEWLLFSGDDVDTEDKSGKTPLHHACSKGHFDMVRMLVDRGASVNGRDRAGWSVLNSAGWHGDPSIARLLIERGADVHGSDKDGWTPLHSASGCGNPECTRVLIESGSDVNRADNYGKTPLFYACRYGHLEAARLLIGSGAAVNISDGVGWTPLHFACGNGLPSLIQLLVENKADVNSVGKLGWTPLHTSCSFARLEAAKLLLQSGADGGKRSNSSQTPLDVVRVRKEEFAKLFSGFSG